MRIEIPQYVSAVINALENHGFEAWCVGGCVRDSLSARPPLDWDIATSARPEEMKLCFSSFHTADTGIKHGTVTVISEGKPVEVTAYRSDGEYEDHRHPVEVSFSRKIEDDLSRRDFTVNALAYHPERGLLDLFGGLEDLERKILRCVGEPEKRFDEDALRILRCLRFSSVLGFSIEERTKTAAQKLRELLETVSHERVNAELTKLLCGKNTASVLRENREIIFTVLPELEPMYNCAQETKYHCFDVWEHTLHALENASAEPSLRWAVLLHDTGKPAKKFYSEDGDTSQDRVAHFYGHPEESRKIAENILTRLRFSNKDKEHIITLVSLHEQPLPFSEKRLRRLLVNQGEEFFFELLDIMRADLAGQAPELFGERSLQIAETENAAKKLIEGGACLKLKELKISGRELLELGYPQGAELGKVLERILDAVRNGRLLNDREKLIAYAEKKLKKRRQK